MPKKSFLFIAIHRKQFLNTIPMQTLLFQPKSSIGIILYTGFPMLIKPNYSEHRKIRSEHHSIRTAEKGPGAAQAAPGPFSSFVIGTVSYFLII